MTQIRQTLAIPAGHVASAVSSYSIASPPDPGLHLDPPPPNNNNEHHVFQSKIIYACCITQN